jgi:uncharacterized protein
MATIATSLPSTRARSLKRLIAHHPLAAYFTIAFAAVWLALLPAVLARNGLGLLPFTVPDAAFVVLFIGGTLLGPTAGAFVVTAVTDGKPGVRLMLRRYTQWRISIRWYVLALFGYIGLQLVAASAWLGMAPLYTLIAQWPLLFTAYLPGVLAMSIFPALVEEPGWRGFALPRLQVKYGALLATLLLGLLHGIWHLPVYALVSGPAAMGPFNIIDVIMNTVSIMALTVMWTWVFNNAKGSILMAILLHAASNATGNFFSELFPNLPAQFGLTLFGLYIVSAVLIIIGTRGRLGYTPERNAPLVANVQPSAEVRS